MTKLVMTKGLPGSGKSTWAKAWVAEDPDHRARVNQDDIRQMLCLGEWSQGKEKRVRASRVALIGALLGMGLDVVSDDTNLAFGAQQDLKALAFLHGADLVLQDFTGVRMEECIKRDEAREGGVGESVIRRMHERYLA
jgi:predicted kinase